MDCEIWQRKSLVAANWKIFDVVTGKSQLIQYRKGIEDLEAELDSGG